MDPLIITVALVGGELTRKDTPHLPLTPAEIGAEAVAVSKAGAAIVHLHARDENGVPKHAPALFAKIIEEIRGQAEAAGIEPPIMQFSTGGSIGMSLAERLAPLALSPDMASLTTGTVNFGDDIFENRRDTVEATARELQTRRIAVEVEVFDAGMIDNARMLLQKGLLTEPFHVNFVLGVPGGLGGDPQNLMFLIGRLPPRCTWSVAAIGKYQLPLTTMAIAIGGHVRVGLEDNIFIRKGELARGNVPFVERAVRIARELNRSVATVVEARQRLGISSRN